MVEIALFTVAMDLHKDRSNPDNNKENNPDTLTAEEFIEFVRKAFEEDKETIGAGSSVSVVDKWYGTFGETYEKAVK